jgi:hypothetical protein
MSALPQALPLALTAAFYPPAILVVILLLTGDHPRRLVLAYLAGAALIVVPVGTESAPGTVRRLALDQRLGAGRGARSRRRRMAGRLRRGGAVAESPRSGDAALSKDRDFSVNRSKERKRWRLDLFS